MRKVLARIASGPRAAAELVRKTFDLRDAFVFTGVAFAIYGGETLYPGAGWFVAGVGLFWLGTKGV